MSTQPDHPAAPYSPPQDAQCYFGGLTKREHFAALAMQGLASREEDLYATDIAKLAVMCADRLIAALNEETK